jgi:CBS domain-containing protein
MTVADIATVGVVTASPDTTAEVLVELMADKDVGSVVVVRNDCPVGVVTDRDLLLGVFAESDDPTEVTAGDVMSVPPVTVGADEDVAAASTLMRRHEVRRLPVVDGDAELTGIVTFDDVMRLVGAEVDNLVSVVRAES